ncbi:MAG: hypothetical protein ABSB60_03155 [Terracidiphilus sp.]|jgi:hypothetical protein
MAEHTESMTCVQFQNQLPELIGSGTELSADPHLKHCQVCKALLGELEAIAEAARALFPMMEPPDAVWEQIEASLKSEGERREPEGITE